MGIEDDWDLVFMSDPHNESENHAKSIKGMGSQPACKGIVIVGDLTEFGHGPELEKYKKLYEKSAPCTIYPALGNHDYENNVKYKDKCDNNGCPTNMVNYLIDSVDKLRPSHPEIKFDIKYDKAGKKKSNSRQFRLFLGYW
jgi:predicted MPP superfamily phosphohydrolase